DLHEKAASILNRVGANQKINPEHSVKDSFSELIGGALEVISAERGKISCLLHVKTPILNAYRTLHGGAVGSVAERIAFACARTLPGNDDKHLVLGELSISYLSAASFNDEVIVDSHVVRSGRNVAVVALSFKLKPTNKLVYVARVTFYNTTPISSL
ncbi:hypothetical protein M569_04383, partial [Genlisea aurea]